MTKNDIVIDITNALEKENINVKQVEVKAVVQKFLDQIAEIVIANGRLELRNFGVFVLKIRKPRLGRNPKSGVPVTVPRRRTIVFYPGKIMEEKLRAADRADTSPQSAPAGAPAAGT